MLNVPYLHLTTYTTHNSYDNKMRPSTVVKGGMPGGEYSVRRHLC